MIDKLALTKPIDSLIKNFNLHYKVTKVAIQANQTTRKTARFFLFACECYHSGKGVSSLI